MEVGKTNTGWWYTYPSEKYEFVSWDYDIPNIWKNKKFPNHQPESNTIIQKSIEHRDFLLSS